MIIAIISINLADSLLQNRHATFALRCIVDHILGDLRKETKGAGTRIKEPRRAADCHGDRKCYRLPPRKWSSLSAILASKRQQFHSRGLTAQASLRGRGQADRHRSASFIGLSGLAIILDHFRQRVGLGLISTCHLPRSPISSPTGCSGTRIVATIGRWSLAWFQSTERKT